MKKVAIYARVSTADQSPEIQLKALREYCQNRDFAIFREYVDFVTGNVEKRQLERTRKDAQYQELLRDAHRKKFDIVLVWKFDRFARSLVSLLTGLQTFAALGIDFISYTEVVDTTTPMGRLFFGMIGSLAEFERSLILERTRAGIANARRKGVKFGRPRNPVQEVRIQAMRAKGMSFRAIAKAEGKSLAGVVLCCKRVEEGA